MCSGRMNDSASMRALSSCGARAARRARVRRRRRCHDSNPRGEARGRAALLRRSRRALSRSTSSASVAKVRPCIFVMRYFSRPSPLLSSSSSLTPRHSGCVRKLASVVRRNSLWRVVRQLRARGVAARRAALHMTALALDARARSHLDALGVALRVRRQAVELSQKAFDGFHDVRRSRVAHLLQEGGKRQRCCRRLQRVVVPHGAGVHDADGRPCGRGSASNRVRPGGRGGGALTTERCEAQAGLACRATQHERAPQRHSAAQPSLPQPRGTNPGKRRPPDARGGTRRTLKTPAAAET
jgi:hypothetical protein